MSSALRSNQHQTLIVYAHGSLDNTNDIYFNAPQDKSIILFNTVGNKVTLPINEIEKLKSIYHRKSSLYTNNDKTLILTDEGTNWIKNIISWVATPDGIKQYVSLQRYYNHRNNVDIVQIPNLLLYFDERSGAQLIYGDGAARDIKIPSPYINLKDLIEKYNYVNSFLIIACLTNNIGLTNSELNLLSRIVKPSNRIFTRSNKKLRVRDIYEWNKAGITKNKKTKKKRIKK